jgi:hypothetical protein
MDGMRAGCSVVRSLKLSSGKTLEPKQTQRVPPLVETNDIHAIFRWQTAEDRKKTLGKTRVLANLITVGDMSTCYHSSFVIIASRHRVRPKTGKKTEQPEDY